jgi:hypothetical protein
VCSGFPKRSCATKGLKRDDDSTHSHRALGSRLGKRNLSSAAHLKFLQRKRQVRPGTSNGKAALEVENLLVPTTSRSS